MKDVIWDPVVKKKVKSLATSVKKELGTLLLILQQGGLLGMPQSRPIKIVHKSAFELRLKDKDGVYRVFYVLFDKNTIFIPHTFIKKDQKTPMREIQIAKTRLKRLIDENK